MDDNKLALLFDAFTALIDKKDDEIEHYADKFFITFKLIYELGINNEMEKLLKETTFPRMENAKASILQYLSEN